MKHSRLINFFPISSVLILSYLLTSCNKDNKTDYSVMQGNFRQTVIESGELLAVNASTLMMPRINSLYSSNLKIIDLATHGKTVKKGEVVVTIDPSTVQKYIIEKKESLENEVAASKKLKLQLANNMQDLRAQLRNEEAQFNMKKLEKEKSAFETASIRKVIELEYEQSVIKINKLKRTINNRIKRDSLDLRIQQIRLKQRESDLNNAIATLDQLNVLSPLEGVFVIEKNPRTGQTIKIGDEMYIGYPVAQIPDIKVMKVNGTVSENDISKIRQGQPVIVRLDALPEVPFHGKISKVSKVCTEKDKKKVFLTEVVIEETDLRLKPGMTVRCEYVTYESNDATFVPSECLLEENKHFYAFVKKRGKIKKTEIEPGLSNNLYTIVKGDINPGQYLVHPEDVLTQQ